MFFLIWVSVVMGASPPPSLVLGGLFPLTSSGVVRLAGEMRAKAFELAIDNINSDDSILPRTQLAGIVANTNSDPSKGLIEAINMIGRVHGIVGAASSSVSMAVSLLCQQYQLPQISYSSTSPTLSEREFFMRVVPPDSTQGAAIAAILLEMGWTQVATICTSDTYGIGGVSAFVEAADALGISVLTRQEFVSGTEDVTDELEHVLDSGARIIVMFVIEADARRVLLQANEAGLVTEGYTWVGSDGWLTDAVINSDELKDIALGVIGTTPGGGFGPLYDAFVAQWNSLGLFPGEQINLFAPHAYDAAMTFARALHQLIERDALLNGTHLLAELKALEFQGLTGLIKFDLNGDRIAPYEVVNHDGTSFRKVGRWTPLKGFQALEPFTWRGGVAPSGEAKIPCSDGFERVVQASGAVSCSQCMPGFFAPKFDPTCSACPAGFYSGVQSTSCHPCPGGSFAPSNGSKACVPCSERSYQPLENSTRCFACPSNAVRTLQSGEATSVRSCICEEHFYGPAGGPCVPCDQTASACPLGSVLPHPQQGYWRETPTSVVFLKCRNPNACNGGLGQAEECASGYSGRMCAVCQAHFYRSGQQCLRCPKSGNYIKILLFIALFVLISLGFAKIAHPGEPIEEYEKRLADMHRERELLEHVVKKWRTHMEIPQSSDSELSEGHTVEASRGGTRSAVTRSSGNSSNSSAIVASPTIAISYFQMMGIFADFGIDWPTSNFFILNWMSVFSFNLELAGPECTVQAGFYSKWRVSMFSPFFAIGLYCLVCAAGCLHVMARHKYAGRRAGIIKRWMRTCLVAFVFLMLPLLYVTLVQTTMKLFACQAMADGTKALIADQSRYCYDESWQNELPLGIFGLVCYVSGTPLVSLAIMLYVWYHTPEEELRNHPWVFPLTKKYESHMFFWEVTVMIRKLVIVTAAVIFSENPITQAVFAFAVLFIHLMFLAAFRPFQENHHDFLELALLVSNFVVLLAGILYANPNTEKTLRDGVSFVVMGTVILSFIAIAGVVLFELRFVIVASISYLQRRRDHHHAHQRLARARKRHEEVPHGFSKDHLDNYDSEAVEDETIKEALHDERRDAVLTAGSAFVRSVSVLREKRDAEGSIAPEETPRSTQERSLGLLARQNSLDQRRMEEIDAAAAASLARGEEPFPSTSFSDGVSSEDAALPPLARGILLQTPASRPNPDLDPQSDGYTRGPVYFDPPSILSTLSSELPLSVGVNIELEDEWSFDAPLTPDASDAVPEKRVWWASLEISQDLSD